MVPQYLTFHLDPLMSSIRLLAVCLSAFLAGAAVGERPDSFRRFEAQTIDPDLGIGYAVTLADMDGDGRTDIVAVNQNQVRWYQNPGWEKHTILSDVTPRDNVCIAA